MKKILTLLFSAVALNGVTAALPVIKSANNTTFTVGVPGSFTFAATNPPLTPGTWQASGGAWPGNVSLDPTTGKLSGTPLLADVGTYSRSITVANATGTSLAQTFTLTVRDVPRMVILKEASPFTKKSYSFRHDATNVTSDCSDNILEADEIAADSALLPASLAGTLTTYYILDMVAQQYARVYFETIPASAGSPAQKRYWVAPAAPFTDGFIDATLPSRTLNTQDVVFGKANPDLAGNPASISEDMNSYRGLASPLAVTKATATVPAWTIPFAVKSFSGKGFDYGKQVLPTADPAVEIHQFNFDTYTLSAVLDSVLTPQANTGGLLPKMDPATGLPKVPAENWAGLASNTMAYGIQLVKNALEKLKYSESP